MKITTTAGRTASLNPHERTATLDYLNAVEVDDRGYQHEVMRLRDALLAAQTHLRRLHRRLVPREPGGIATA